MDSGIKGRGRRGFTIVPNWRWEDPGLDPYELRIAGWLASHADSYRCDHVTRNAIAEATGISPTKVSDSIARLRELGIVSTERVADPRGTTRWLITFDFDAWETRSPDDQGGGRHTTRTRSPHDQGVVATRPGTRSPHDRVEEQGEKNRENTTENPPSSPRKRGERALPDDVRFNAWWECYPRKVDRRKCAVRWSRLNEDQRLAAMGGLTKWLVYWATLEDQRLVPHPSTWLYNARWEADPPPPPKPATQQNPYLDMLRQPGAPLSLTGPDHDPR